MTSEELKTFGGEILDAWKEIPQDKNVTHQRGSFPIPITILERYKEIKLAGDMIFINRIRFINNTWIHVNFMMEEHTSNKEASTLQEYIRQFNQVYMKWGFNINNILMYGKLRCIRGNLAELKINLNICSNNEHVGDIERLNCTVKERDRGICWKPTKWLQEDRSYAKG